tara:strand:+ start:193 stop:402 length:210 start_codon:yes stop_codon:yes gene_type:complete
MKAKHSNYQRIADKIDAPIRDIEIRAMWDGLTYTDMKYKEKIDVISKKYYVSDKVVEHALNEIPKTEQV